MHGHSVEEWTDKEFTRGCGAGSKQCWLKTIVGSRRDAVLLTVVWTRFSKPSVDEKYCQECNNRTLQYECGQDRDRDREAEKSWKGPRTGEKVKFGGS